MKKKITFLLIALLACLGMKAQDVVEISNVEQLKAFRDAVNSGTTYAGQTVKLTDELDLSSEGNWTPIGNLVSYPGQSFNGIFDGDGFTISNVTCYDYTPNHAVAGLFGSVVNGTIKNLTVKNVNLKSTHYAGGIVAYTSNAPTIENCKVIGGTISSTPELLNGSYDNGDKVGGIMGYATAGSTINNCTVQDVTIKAYRDFGGIVGYSAGTVKNSRLIYANLARDAVFEDITATTGAYAGFNVKTSETLLIKDCQVTTPKYAFRDYNDAYAGIITLEGNTFISTSTESDEGAIVNRGGSTDAKINVNSGTYVGEIKALNGKKAIVISGGHFSAPLGNGENAQFIAEGMSGVNGIYLTETPQAPNGLGEAVATLSIAGGTPVNYATLEAAFADATDDSEIKLLKDCSGNGIFVGPNKFTETGGLEVDFNNFTYTIDGSTVGSTGTETQAFHLEKDNYITFKNGTIYSENAKMLVQNYSNLYLEGMTLTLANDNYASGYTLSNNNGNVTIASSIINANTGGGFAFDVCRYSSYPSVSVTVREGSEINGDVEVSASGSDAKEGFTLMLEDGEIKGDIVLDATAKAAMAASPDIALVRERDSFGQEAPADYKWETDAPGESRLVPANYVAQVDDKKYETFSEAATAAAGSKVILLLKDIADTYGMSVGETLKVQKAGFAFNDPTAPTSYSLKTMIEGPVTIYSLKAAENFASITDGYYHIKNLGNEKYVNVKGRRTATVDATEADTRTAAGTVIKVKATNGQVEVLRSQAIDLPHYAERAMSYVPEVAKLIVEKLNATGSGEILGTTGFDTIMKKFNENFDYHLHVVYVDEEGDKYRIYGQIPTMKPVVEFYNEHKSNVDYKLKDLEDAVNNAIGKLVDKLGMGESLRNSFSLETIWSRMGGNLTKPADDATKIAFLQEVLSNEKNVWDFAYQTVTFYMEKVENSQYFSQLPEEAQVYWNRAKNVRPGYKYYIVQNNNKMDIFSQANTGILNDDPSTMWALEPVTEMTVNVPEENSRIIGATFDENGKRTGFKTGYYTTLYTDFAYQLPEGVVALKVTDILDTYLESKDEANKLTYDKEGITLGLGLLKTAEIGQDVPAQTPVLIMAKSAGDIAITIGDDFGASADVSGNILRGADYLISEYEINTPALAGLFDMVKDKVSAELTDKYEHLIRKNSGTVNNKFFFSLNIDEELAAAYKAKTGNDMKTSPVLTLSKLSGKKLAFNESWDNIQPNTVFLFSEEKKPALFTLTGDVTGEVDKVMMPDGIIDVSDVTGQVNIVQERDKKEYNYDYEAAEIVVDSPYYIDVDDVTGNMNIIQKRTKHPDLP